MGRLINYYNRQQKSLEKATGVIRPCSVAEGRGLREGSVGGLFGWNLNFFYVLQDISAIFNKKH